MNSSLPWKRLVRHCACALTLRQARGGDGEKSAKGCSRVQDIFILTLSCEDRPGLVAGVASLLASHGCNILDAQQYNDEGTGRFFMRLAFERMPEAKPVDQLRATVEQTA